jgi:phosphoribosylanthranilate isomerase
MALKTVVYVRAVDNLGDARYCAGMGVDMIGFNLNPGDTKHLSLQQAEEIAGWLSGVALVGDFGASEPVPMQKQFDYLEFSRPELVHEFAKLHVPLILHLSLTEHQTVESIVEACQYCREHITHLIISSEVPLDDRTLEQIKEVASTIKTLLAFPMAPQAVEHILERTGAAGVVLKGGNEIRPGYNNYDELADMLEALEVDEFAD